MFADSSYYGNLCDALDLASPSFKHSEASVAWNLLNDWRINPDRLMQFESFVANAGLGGTSILGKAGLLSKYYESHIRKACPANGRPCDFTQVDNDYNRYYSLGIPKANPHRLISTVISLTNYGLRRLYDAPIGLEPEFDYSTLPVASKGRISVSAWLDLKLGSHLNDGAVSNPPTNPFLVAVVRQLSLAMTSLDLDHEPVWVTYTRDLERLAGNDPFRWRSLVGVSNDPVHHPWLLILTYPLSRVGDRLYRPTQLESGYNPLHFPPPPTTLHGLAMDTDHIRRHCPLPEFIHGRIDHQDTLDDPLLSPIRHCIRIPDSSSSSRLAEAQKKHLSLLAKHFPLSPNWPKPEHPALVAP